MKEHFLVLRTSAKCDNHSGTLIFKKAFPLQDIAHLLLIHHGRGNFMNITSFHTSLR